MERTVWEHCRGWCGRKAYDIPQGEGEDLANRRLRLNDEGEEAMWNSGERTFKAEGMESLKALRQKQPELLST